MKNVTFRTDINLWKNFNNACKKSNKSRGQVLREFMEEYIQNNKEEKEMTRREFIEQLKGNSIVVDSEWLQENDEGLLEWITTSAYWGRGFDKEISHNEVVVKIEFDAGGVRYYATFESHPEGVRQSLANQEPWGEDSWNDWGTENIQKYLNKLKGGIKMLNYKSKNYVRPQAGEIKMLQKLYPELIKEDHRFQEFDRFGSGVEYTDAVPEEYEFQFKDHVIEKSTQYVDRGHGIKRVAFTLNGEKMEAKKITKEVI